MSGPAAAAPSIASFDYDSMEPALASEARAIANRIRGRLKAGYIATGHDLLDMKERLGHGRFGSWLAAEFGMTARTAERYMSAARLEVAEYDTVSDLPVATMQALAAPSLPASVRATCIEKIKAGTPMLPRDIKRVAADAKFQQNEKARQEKKLPRGKAARTAEIDARAARERDREAADQRAMRKRQVLVNLIVESLGSRRGEALQLLKQLSAWSIDRELLDALTRRGCDT